MKKVPAAQKKKFGKILRAVHKESNFHVQMKGAIFKKNKKAFSKAKKRVSQAHKKVKSLMKKVPGNQKKNARKAVNYLRGKLYNMDVQRPKLLKLHVHRPLKRAKKVVKKAVVHHMMGKAEPVKRA